MENGGAVAVYDLATDGAGVERSGRGRWAGGEEAEEGVGRTGGGGRCRVLDLDERLRMVGHLFVRMVVSRSIDQSNQFMFCLDSYARKS